MEENYKTEDTPLTRLVGRYVNNLIDYEMFEKAVKKLYSDKEENKSNLKPFDIKAAKVGKPVCTKDGKKVRIICFNRVFYSGGYKYPIVAMVNDNGNELVYAYTQDGLLVGNEECKLDLMMLHEKKEGWIYLYKDKNRDGDAYISKRIFSTKEEAEQDVKDLYKAFDVIDIRKIEWEV